jgi:hypothetical protein
MSTIYSLYAGLVSYWPLNDVNDMAGTGNTLTNNNAAPLSRNPTGPAQNGFGQFNSASSQYLSLTDNALVSTGDIDWTICCWVQLTAKGADRTIISKYGAAGTREYNLFFNNASDRFQLTISGDGTAVTTLLDNNLGSPNTSEWYFLRAWHDATGNTINLQSNLNTVNSTAHTTGSFDSSSALLIGAVVPSAPISHMYGLMSDIIFWKRLLTTQEHAWLYNNGLGRRFPWVNATSPSHLGRGSGTMVRRNRITGVIV